MKYLYLERSQENPLERRIAELAAKEASRVLSIPVPTIRFFRRYPHDGFVFGECFHRLEDWISGYAEWHHERGSMIALRAGLPEVELAKTTIHEVRHIWQFRSAVWCQRGTDAREADAMQFEESWPR